MSSKDPENVNKDSDDSKIELSKTMLNIYRIFCLFSVFLVYVGSVFMTYVILSDVIFQILHLFVTLTQLFEVGENTFENRLKLYQQVCWVIYSFSIISMIVMIIIKQYTSFFSTMWDSLGKEQVTEKISAILNNPNIKRSYFVASMVVFVLYFIATIGAFLLEIVLKGCVGTSGFLILVFFIPIMYGIAKIIIEAWRIAFQVFKGTYSKYQFKPLEPFPNFPFPTDLIDPAKLREQEEFLNFIMDERTNVYLTDGHTGKKIFGYLHVVALIIGICIRVYFMFNSNDIEDWSGLLICAFYLFASPLLIFCNFMSTFLPDSAFTDDGETDGTRSFDKGSLHLIFYLVNAVYLVIFLLLIVMSILLLLWKRPEEVYNYKFFTDSSLMRTYYNLTKASATTCQVDIKGISFSQLSALPMLTYFGKDSGHSSDVDDHNRKVIINIALNSFKEKKVTEVDYKCMRDGIHIRDNKLHLFIINGIRRAIDFILLFEQFIQYYFFMILKSLIPFYAMAYGKFRVALIVSTRYFTKMTGCEFLTTQIAKRIHDDITMNCIPKNKSWHKYTNIAIGHLTGGYFAKYLSTYKLPTKPEIAGIGFDSLSFQGTPLEIENTREIDFGMTLNVFARGGIYSDNEPNTKNNFERKTYGSIVPPDAVQSFCHSVAMCSNDRYEIDFCNTMMKNWDDVMKQYGREKSKDQFDINKIDVATNKGDYITK